MFLTKVNISIEVWKLLLNQIDQTKPDCFGGTLPENMKSMLNGPSKNAAYLSKKGSIAW